MNRVTKEGDYVLGCMVRDMQSTITTTEGGSTRWIKTELEFEGGLEYKGERYERLAVVTRSQLANTVPVETYIRNGKANLESNYGKDPLVSHTSTLEKLIRIYKKGE